METTASHAQTLITLGALLLGGLAVETIGRRLPVPRVTLLLIFGYLIGPDMAGFLDASEAQRWFEPMTTIALVMVGFLIGEKFHPERMRAWGRVALIVSLVQAIATAAVTTLGLMLLGIEPAVALLLGGVACATAPAATFDVVREESADGPLTDTLMGVVAFDDAWALLIFSLAAAAVAVMTGMGEGNGFLFHALREVGGALLLGGVLGLLAGLLTQRIRPGEPTLLEALGIVLLTAGLATLWNLSFILAAITLGAVMTNVARHHERAFHEIEHIEWPFLLLFFVLAGASLHLDVLLGVGVLGFAYVALRVIGKIGGGVLGVALAGGNPTLRRWLGPALLPQAGIALGLALIIEQRFPEIDGYLLTMVIAATVIFEIFGPPCTRLALRRAGEAGQARPDGEDETPYSP
ncbi:MAG: cation:proton antiporter [Wenzhouxiangella sp.]|jgi:Kef-type K+ transport system membrane component KefB|nr:cation:proton antiporter [Wenzhouxiangella sp.]